MKLNYTVQIYHEKVIVCDTSRRDHNAVEHNGRKNRRNRRHLRLSTIGADHQLNTERARSTANSRVTRLAAVTPPGQSSESNARTTGISPNDQRPGQTSQLRRYKKRGRQLLTRICGRSSLVRAERTSYSLESMYIPMTHILTRP